ncbi:hypothetical protein, partial [Escherichia coli]|uniref:hypothetical protein n=1 Tax=Escherichia coli TaxID=562 RepID=UPI0032E50AC6
MDRILIFSRKVHHVGRSRDTRDNGADLAAGTGPVSRHAQDDALGAARHLGPVRGMPVWLKVVTTVLSLAIVGG